MINKDTLAYFSGTENYHRHGYARSFVLTDGCNYVRENGGQNGAFWLFDIIQSYQNDPKIRKCDGFQVWKLIVQPDKSAVIVLEDGNNHKVLDQKIDYTDFDLPEITIWVEDSGDGNGNLLRVALLPSEH